MTYDDYLIRHTGFMSQFFAEHYIETGEFQMPLFDTEDFESTWKTTDSWNDFLDEADTNRETLLAASRGEQK